MAAADAVVGHALLAGGVGVVRHRLLVFALAAVRSSQLDEAALDLYVLCGACLRLAARAAAQARLIIFLGCRVRALRKPGQRCDDGLVISL